jgi:hypothetical protein
MVKIMNKLMGNSEKNVYIIHRKDKYVFWTVSDYVLKLYNMWYV